MFAVRALNIDALGQGFDVAQIIVERDKKHEEEMQLIRRMIVENPSFLREMHEQLLQKPAPSRP
jgi:hypothetical protein